MRQAHASATSRSLLGWCSGVGDAGAPHVPLALVPGGPRVCWMFAALLLTALQPKSQSALLPVWAPWRQIPRADLAGALPNLTCVLPAGRAPEAEDAQASLAQERANNKSLRAQLAATDCEAASLRAANAPLEVSTPADAPCCLYNTWQPDVQAP